MLSVLFIHDHHQGKLLATKHERQRIQGIASTLAPHLDGTLLAAIESSAPAEDAFPSWRAAPPDIQTLQHALAQTQDLNDLSSDIYTLSLVPEQRAAVIAAPDRVHPGAVRFGLTSGPQPYWHHRYDYRPEMAAAFFDGVTSGTDVYEDEHGTWISAYAPIFSEDGRVVALLEVDAPLSLLLAESRARSQQRALMLGLVMAGMMVLITIMVRRMTSSLRHLAQVAKHVGAGEHHVPIQASGVAEVVLLSEALESTRLAIAEHLAQQRDAHQTLQRALEQAQAATRTKSEFLTIISHELRTPLNGVLGMSALLQDMPMSNGQQQCVSMIQESGSKLLRTVEDMLEFAQSSATPPAREPFSPRSLVESMAAQVAPEVQERGLAMQLALHQDLPLWLVGDAPRLQHILLNLLNNAIKFTPAGSIHIRAQCISDARGVRLEIAIEDTGIGISSADQERLFEPFTQADTSSTRRFGGIGMGLAVCRRLSHQIGGDIDLHSVPGVGSCFTFWCRVSVLHHTDRLSG